MILRVLSWLLPLHLVLAVVSLFLLSNRDVFVCCTLAVASVMCSLSLHAHERMDARLAKGLAAQHSAQDALVHVVDVVAGEAPTPARRTTRPLRAVPDDA